MDTVTSKSCCCSSAFKIFILPFKILSISVVIVIFGSLMKSHMRYYAEQEALVNHEQQPQKVVNTQIIVYPQDNKEDFLLNIYRMTIEKLGTKMDTLESKLDDFKEAVRKIDIKLLSLSEKYSLNMLIQKCSQAISARNDIGANKLWAVIRKYNYSDTSPDEILDSIIINSYTGIRVNILPLVRFISHTKVCSGYKTLFEEMQDYGHFYDGGEIFSLAHSIRVNCVNQTVFERMPIPVKRIFAGPVTLQNTFNKGYLFRKQNLHDNAMENQIATIKKNNTADLDAFQLVPTDTFAETFSIQHGQDFIMASSSRRMYFSTELQSRFLLEMNRKYEINIGLELEDNRGNKKTFYRLYVQKQRLRNGEVYEVNLWTINPKDEYYKYIYWTVGEPQNV